MSWKITRETFHKCLPALPVSSELHIHPAAWTAALSAWVHGIFHFSFLKTQGAVCELTPLQLRCCCHLNSSHHDAGVTVQLSGRKWEQEEIYQHVWEKDCTDWTERNRGLVLSQIGFWVYDQKNVLWCTFLFPSLGTLFMWPAQTWAEYKFSDQFGVPQVLKLD